MASDNFVFKDDFLECSFDSQTRKLSYIKLFSNNAIRLYPRKIVFFLTVLKQAIAGRLDSNVEVNTSAYIDKFVVGNATYNKANVKSTIRFTQLKNNNKVYLQITVTSYSFCEIDFRNNQLSAYVGLVCPKPKTLTEFEMRFYIELLSKMSFVW